MICNKRVPRVTGILSLLLCFLFLSFPLAKAQTDADLEVFISTDDDLQAVGAIIFQVRNVSDKTIEVLTWGTPLEGMFTSRSFVIFHNEKKVKYRGRLVKRNTPDDNDFITLMAGESTSAVSVLPDGYAIDDPGEYEVYFSGYIKYRKREETQSGKMLRYKPHRNKKANELLLKVTSVPKFKAAALSAATSTTCSSDQLLILEDVLVKARNYATDSVVALTNTALAERGNAGRYISWFGVYQEDRYATISNHFSALKDTIDNQMVEFICDCTVDSFAYVYPDEPFKIHLCNSFWEAPLIGTNSMSGTVIHEMSHFEGIAATDDHIYGLSGSFSLALDAPETAIMNADSFEFFAENTPFLPMAALATMTDNLADSQNIDNLNSYSALLTYEMTAEQDEPNHAAIPGGRSAWLSWISQGTGVVTVNTFGSSYDTLLAVYTGEDLNSLVEVGSNDDAGEATQSEVVFQADAGTVYHIAVDGYGGMSGLAYLTLVSGFGDVNNDITIDLKDAILGLQLLSGVSLTEPITRNADINGDSRISLEEVLFILNQMEN